MQLTKADLDAVERELCRRSLAEFAKRDEIKSAINEVLVPQVKSRAAKAKAQ